MTGSSDDELAFAGPAALAELVRRRQVHPRELVELYLRRIERLDKSLNAFRTTMPEQALVEADSAFNRNGPLVGVPVAIKDDQAVAGEPTTQGSRTYGPPQPADGETARRLRIAGAIPIGITNVPELETKSWTATEANGITRNPWDPARTPGGSSGGSATAVAAGMVAAATGSDAGGSVRQPAACCGLVGMKPTRGHPPVPRPDQGWLGLGVYGPLTRTVRDNALMLEALRGGGTSIEDGYVHAASAKPGRLRVAISRKVPFGLTATVSPEPRIAWEGTATLLGELGHEVTERDPEYGLAETEFAQTWLRAIYEASRRVPDRAELERATRQLAAIGRVLVPTRRRDRLIRKRTSTTRRILALWHDVDVLLTPGMPLAPVQAEGPHALAPPLAVANAGRLTAFMAVFNLTGQPAVSVPAGFDSDGLPLSVQLVGRPGAEETLYSLAAQIETARPWANQRPPSSRVDQR